MITSSLSLSQITGFEESQLTRCKDAQEALWRNPYGEDTKHLAIGRKDLRPPANCDVSEFQNRFSGVP